MGVEAMAVNDGEPEVLCHWSARKIQPVILLYVGMVFVVFMVLAYFVFHSTEAVKALAATAFAALLPLTLGINSRLEYRLTELGLERRRLESKPKDFKDVFRLERLSHIVRIRYGFKYYLPLDEPNPLRRFWKVYVSDKYSGEVHVETADKEGVFEVLTRYGIPIR